MQSEPRWLIWYTPELPENNTLAAEYQKLDRFDRHRGPVTCVAGIPGRQAAVSSGYDSAVGIVDFENDVIDLLGYHHHLVNRVVVNHSGSLAATCSSDYSIGLWDLNTLQRVRTLQGHWDDVEDFTFVDDKTGISVSRDRRIFIWNLETGAVQRVLEKHDRDVLSVEYDKGKIYTSGDDMTLRQWDLESGELLRTWGPFEVETDTCAIDPLNDRVILGSDDGDIRIYDCQTGELLHQIVAHKSSIKKVAVSPLNGDILSAAYDQQVLVWDAESLELKLALESHASTWERSLNWTPDGRGILAGTFDGTVLHWDATNGRQITEIGGNSFSVGNSCINDISTNSHGLAAMASDDGYIRLAQLSPTDSKWIQIYKPDSGRILMNAVCLDDTQLLAGTHDQKLQVFTLIDGRLGKESELNLNEGPINCIQVAATGAAAGEAFAACYSGAIVRISLRNGRAETRQKFAIHGGAVKSLRMEPGGLSGVSCAADGSMFSWTHDGEIIRQFVGHTAIVDDVDFNPSGSAFASVSRDFTVNVYDYDSGRIRHSILLGRQSPKCVLFWNDHTIIVGNYWGDLWRVDLRQESVSAFRIASNGISSLSRCGEYIAAVSYDGSVCLVDPSDMSVINRINSMQQKLSGFESSAHIN
jgi:WD40 repeat protein